MDDLNQVAIAGRLTRDPQIRTTRSGMSICSLRIACNKMFFNVKVWGDQGKELTEALSKGDVVQVEGRLDWYEWNPGDGPRREYVGVVANDTPGSVKCTRMSSPGSAPAVETSVAPVDITESTMAVGPVIGATSAASVQTGNGVGATGFASTAAGGLPSSDQSVSAGPSSIGTDAMAEDTIFPIEGNVFTVEENALPVVDETNLDHTTVTAVAEILPEDNRFI
jgi:single-strand DNA-binding protein